MRHSNKKFVSPGYLTVFFLFIFSGAIILNNVASFRYVDLNTASVEELQEIIHIGPARAQEIIEKRPFSSIDDLTRVSGIGPKRLSDIKEQGIACTKEDAKKVESVLTIAFHNLKYNFAMLLLSALVIIIFSLSIIFNKNH